MAPDGKQPIDLRNGKIEFSLEDPIEKREVENFLKLWQHSAEYTLNSEVLRIEPIRLLELMADNIEGATKGFAQVVKKAVEDQAKYREILKPTSFPERVAKVRSLVHDAGLVLKICQGLVASGMFS